MSLHLVAFGAPSLTRDGAPAPPELGWRKHFALLVYLARSPGRTRRRDHLVGLLWPDKDESRARHSLNEASRAIRRAAGDDALASDAESLTLAADCLTTDWSEAEASLARGDAARVAELWRGDFLEGFGIPDATAFEDWLASERLAWRSRFRDALAHEAARLLEIGDATRALALASQVLSADPSAEAALRTAMTADALLGSAPAALERFDAYAAWLWREHGATAPPGLAALAARIRAGTRTAAHASRVATLQAPLVGRARVMARIAEFLPRGGAPPAVVLITGAPGHGKTRLVRELSERARLGGALTIVVSCIASDADTPGTALGEILRRGLSAAPGLGAAPAAALASLALLDPELEARYPGVGPHAAGGRPAELGGALGAALAAVAVEHPVLVALDGAQLADDASLEALPALLREAGEAPLTLVLGAELDAAAPPALLALRARIGHELRGGEVAAEPLDDGDVAELVAALLPAYDAAQRERLVRRLHADAAGAPLFIVEILRALAGGDADRIWPLAGETSVQPLPFKLPGAVSAALTLRVQALSERARATLLAASVLGPRVDEELLARLTAASAPELEADLGALERAGFLVHDGARYQFGAELARGFLVAQMLAGGERRRLHERAADALAGTGRSESLAFAEHLYGAGKWREAEQAATRVATTARAPGAERLRARAERLAAKAAQRAETG